MMDFVVGTSFRLDYGVGNLNTRVYHIRAIVDDTQFVLRTWSRRWRDWHYEVWDAARLEYEDRHGLIVLLGAQRKRQGAVRVIDDKLARKE